jgi:toxin ParE1/3/4
MPAIEWMPHSIRNLRAIRGYIARDAPETASIFIERIMASTERLMHSPLSGAIVPEFREKEWREVLHGNYRIIYRIRGDLVQILSVFHAARMLDEDSIPGLDDE